MVSRGSQRHHTPQVGRLQIDPVAKVKAVNTTPTSRLVDVLTGLAADRPRVRLVVTGDPDVWVGRLRACGADVLSVELAGELNLTAWVPMDHVSELSLVDER